MAISTIGAMHCALSARAATVSLSGVAPPPHPHNQEATPADGFNLARGRSITGQRASPATRIVRGGRRKDNRNVSAFIVSETHIRSLLDVAINGPSDCHIAIRPGSSAFTGYFTWHAPDTTAMFGARLERLDVGNADRVGQMLWNENYASVNHRYNEAEEPEVFTHLRPRHRLTFAEAFKAINCYEYQSCEHPGWEGSNAKAFCDALTARLIYTLPGYDEAPWGIED